MALIEQLEGYTPWNEQEAADKRVLLNKLRQGGQEVFTREDQTAHMTASAWVVDRAHTQALMIWHNIFQSWSWLGGHADGDQDLLRVAMREVSEESGLTNIHPVSEDIYSIEILTVDGHIKKGAYVSSHLHLNVTYLLEADERESLSIKPDENSGVKWFSLEDAVAASAEPWFKAHVYSKLNEKLQGFHVG